MMGWQRIRQKSTGSHEKGSDQVQWGWVLEPIWFYDKGRAVTI